MDETLLDASALSQLALDVGNDRLGAVLAAFAEELGRRAPLLRAALEARDLAAIGRETHSVKGSALTFGALALGDSARRANDASRAGDIDAAVAAGRRALDLMPRTQAEVGRLIANGLEVRTT